MIDWSIPGIETYELSIELLGMYFLILVYSYASFFLRYSSSLIFLIFISYMNTVFLKHKKMKLTPLLPYSSISHSEFSYLSSPSHCVSRLQFPYEATQSRVLSASLEDNSAFEHSRFKDQPQGINLLFLSFV